MQQVHQTKAQEEIGLSSHIKESVPTHAFCIDTGASIHITNDLQQLANVVSCQVKVKQAGGEYLRCRKKGHMNVYLNNRKKVQ